MILHRSIIPQINRILVSHVLDLLEPSCSDCVLDLFCGVGNFTLLFSRLVKLVIGIDGNDVISIRALENEKMT
ncbi:MAG: hypothetical protein REV35_01050 [Burkholderia sp.]|nr:hypothetical protein [Burkholderia sp.]